MSISSIQDDINKLKARIEQSLFLSREERQQLVNSVKGLYTAVEPTEEKAWRIVMAPAISAALFAVMRLGVFQHFTKEVMTADEIASKTGAERSLVVRLMRALVVSDIFEEAGEDQYAHNDLSRKLGDKNYQDFLGAIDVNNKFLPHLNDFLESREWRNPLVPNKGLLQYANKTDLTTMEWFMSNPKILQRVGIAMAAIKAVWGGGDIHTLSSLFPPNFSAEVLICDVGAGRGDIVEDLRKYRPDLKGRMVFQDLPPVIAGRENLDGVEGIGHDFFQPQPIKGEVFAKLKQPAFERHVLHDWPDDSCRQVLSNIVDALGPGSRVVIIDQVIPTTGASLTHAAVDISMMGFSGMERSVKQWTALLDAMGLKIASIVRSEAPPGEIAYDSMIEAVAK